MHKPRTNSVLAKHPIIWNQVGRNILPTRFLGGGGRTVNNMLSRRRRNGLTVIAVLI
jgi:hypothetical protein